MDRINNGNIVRHFKGKYYYVIETDAHDSEDHEKRLVVYQSIEGKKIWVRPYEMFMSKVDKIKYPDADQEYRFESV